MNTFRYVAGCKINIQKPVAFLYTTNEQDEKKNLENNSIHNNLKKKERKEKKTRSRVNYEVKYLKNTNK
jgi:hypothetical protein